MDYSALLAMLAQVGGGLLGQAMSAGDRAAMLQLLKDQQKKYAAVEDPRFQDVAPDIYGPSELEGIKSDPRLAQQQLEVDAGLKDVVDSGGLTLQDRAAQAATYDKLARQTSAGNAGIRNNLASRGALNSGASLAMQLANQQNGTQQAADVARDTTADARARALKAMQQRYSNASEMDDTQYARKAGAARAADAINAHNASARRTAGMYANDLQQRGFNNRLSKLNGERGPSNDLVGYYGGEAENKAQIGAAAGNAGATYLMGSKKKRYRQTGDGSFEEI